MLILTHCCLITDNVKRLKEFYSQVLEFEPQIDGNNYVEFQTEYGCVLSLFDLNMHNNMTNEPAVSCLNKSMILEFKVDDINAQYERIKNMGIKLIKDLTTQEWGNTSFWFKDPDGNFLNFYKN